MEQKQTQPTSAWYLLPIFLGWLGGIIMYFKVREDAPHMAKKGLIVGIILSAVGFLPLVFLL